MPQTLFTIGHGYVASRLAARLLAEGWHVTGTTRSPDKARAMAADGITPMLWSGAANAAPPPDAHWLVSTPAGDGDCPGLTGFGHAAASARWIGYLSTTSVYGDHDGGWVYEDTPVTPGSPRGHGRVRAEAGWRATSGPVEIFRLPGIYGPGRSGLDDLRGGTARRIDKPGQVFSRIHVDDIVSGLMAAMQRPRPGRIAHLADDLPSPPGDPVAFAAALLEMPPPPLTPFDEADLSPMARSFYSECKRVSNTATKADLGWQPSYPSYREGLAAILAEDAAAAELSPSDRR